MYIYIISMSKNPINELKNKTKVQEKEQRTTKKRIQKKLKNEWPREKQKALFSFFRFHS